MSLGRFETTAPLEVCVHSFEGLSAFCVLPAPPQSDVWCMRLVLGGAMGEQTVAQREYSPMFHWDGRDSGNTRKLEPVRVFVLQGDSRYFC